MSEKEWIEKIQKECVLNVGNFDIRYAIQLVGRRNSKIGIATCCWHPTNYSGSRIQ